VWVRQKLENMCTAINLFLSKLIDEMQTAVSLSVDSMDESQVTTAEQNRDDMNNFSQETPSRKPRTQQC
jgi:predicted RNA-binding protein Jag